MRRITKLAVLAAMVAAAPLAASARSSYLSTFNSRYGTALTVLDDCKTCHGSGGTSTFNPYGQALKANISTGISAALTAVEPLDSDGDKFSNIDEIDARTLPGDATSVPASTAEPKIAVAPTSLAFGTVTVGDSAAQTAIISNTGDADLTVTSVSRCSGTSAEFSASPTASFTVAAGGSQTLTVRYAPVDATTDAGCITIASNDATAGNVRVDVAGSGQSAPAAVLDVDITRFFATKRVDVSRGGTVTPKVAVVNAGTVAGTATVHVQGTAPDATGAPTVVYTASQDVLLAPGATAKVAFPAYAPTAPPVVDWTASVVDADPDTDAATAKTKVVP